MNNVQKYQSENGLVADGIIGRLTMASMREVWKLNKLQLAHFLGQCHVETNGFLVGFENLRYSTTGLLQIFPKYFTPTLAARYQYNQEMIANIAYSNRLGNGDICSGDGYKYRARGSIGLTGKKNYEEFAEEKGNPEIVCNPDLVGSDYFWDVGLYYFTKNNLWAIGAVTEVWIRAITLKVNGGYNGINERIRWTQHYYNKQ